MNKNIRTKKYKRLRLILGDQLNAAHSWYKEKDPNTLYVIAELQQETNYVVHHVQKVCAFFAAMQQFATALEQAGHHVLHLTLDDTAQFSNLLELLGHLFQTYQVQQFNYQLPDEFRLRQQLADFAKHTPSEVIAFETEHFYLKDSELRSYFTAGKRHRMESFYRKMRTRFNLLMQGDTPEGARWNFDVDNRQKLKPTDFAAVPEPLLFANDVSDILSRLQRHNIKTIGTANQQLLWPANRQQARTLLNFFCHHCLSQFGRFQDAMTSELDHNGILGQGAIQKQWSLYHSRLSFALNSKIISPQEVVNTAIEHYQAEGANISLAQIEGFVRQVIGWREFVRGMYWVNMPSYATFNHLVAIRPLPSWFWTGNTKMNCLKHAIDQSLQYAYAHHIQRLMITGNFCLLTGIAPAEVDEWYLGIYIDAIEWVELPNTRGMSQFADGGMVGSKAYAASGNYVKKMSDYCANCHYKVNKTTEIDACPLNALYWNFIHQHQAALGSNPRNAMVYANWQKKPPGQQAAILNRARAILVQIEQL